jgi:16S rRNA (adenine1518-N6/adenine1519-N6)-dimethyltransferase
VLEIGPGGGVLTRELVAAGARVAAVELDPSWAFHLGRELATIPSAERPDLAIADALALRWEGISPAWRVAGNLPYQVGTAIVERFLAGAPPGVRAAFLLQRELVERLGARAGEPEYGALSVLVAARARVTLLGRVPPGAFAPPPKVESAFVGLETTSPAIPSQEWRGFLATVHAAFGRRRKQLRNALLASFPRARVERALASAGIDPAERAERVDLARFVALSRALNAPSRPAQAS